MQNKEWFFTVACFGAIYKNAEILFSFPMKILQKRFVFFRSFLPKPPSEYEPFFLFPSETKPIPFALKAFDTLSQFPLYKSG